MKHLYAYLIIFFISTSLFAQSYNIGDTIITFDNCYVVTKCPSGHLNLCDEWGNEILPCQYFAIAQASNHLYWGQLDNEYWGNRTLFPKGKDEEDLVFSDWSDFDKGKWLLYNPKGQLALNDTFQYPFSLSQGFGITKMLGGKEGVMTINLTWLIPPIYDYVAYFEDEEYKSQFGFILGKQMSNDSVRFLHPFISSPATSEQPYFKYGLADITGKLLVPIKYDAVGKPYRDMIPVLQNYQIGYYNRKGELVIAPKKENFLRSDINLYANPKNYGPQWYDDDTMIYQGIDSKSLLNLADNLMLKYKLMDNLYHQLPGFETPYISSSYSHADYVLPFERLMRPGIYCQMQHYYYSAPVAASSTSISFQVLYQHCEECIKLWPRCDNFYLYQNYFATPNGVVKSSFNDQFQVPDQSLNGMLNKALAIGYPTIVACMDTSKLFEGANEVAVYNIDGVDFFIDLENKTNNSSCYEIYAEMGLYSEGYAITPYIILSVPYAKLKSYATKGNLLFAPN